MILEALIIGIVAGITCLFASLIGGFVGVFLGYRLIKGYLPGMIWKALTAKDAKGKSLLDLLWTSISGRINGLSGGRPKKTDADQISGGLQNAMGMLQMLQTLGQMKQGTKPPAPPQ